MEIRELEREVNWLHERICYALGDPKRILILYLLAEGGKCVNDIAESLDIPQSTISRHLRVLRERELVETERNGTSVFYTLADSRIIESLNLMREILSTQLDARANLANMIKDR